MSRTCRSVRKCRVGDPSIAVAYLRVSTEEQALGLEAQRAQLERWAHARGVTIASWHVDQGVSGSTPAADRLGLVAAVGALRSGGAGVLCVAKRDRLARDAVEAALVERQVRGLGAYIATADGLGGADDTSLFVGRMLDAVAELERANIRARTRAALAQRKASGKKLGGECPWGWRVGTGGTLEPYEPEQAILRRVAELRSMGLVLRAVLAQLQAEGAKTRRGGPPTLRTVHAWAHARLATTTTTAA